MKPIEKELGNKIVLLVVPFEVYYKTFIEYLKQFSSKKVCYITINKAGDQLDLTLQENDIDTGNFVYIDCISSSLIKKISTKKYIYVSSPKSLTDLSIVIKKQLNDTVDLFVIDSLSNLLVYHDPNTLIRFLHSIINNIKQTPNRPLIMTISKNDIKSLFFGQLNLLIDEVIELKEK